MLNNISQHIFCQINFQWEKGIDFILLGMIGSWNVADDIYKG